MATRSFPGPETAWERSAFFFILLTAAALRLWRLELPSLWFDEVLVAMVAKLPFETIFERALREDFHPPTYYLLAKLAMEMGMSDAVLRLPPVVFGLTGVWFAWKAGRELLDDSAGLLLAALTAVQPWHLLLSRQVRPYSIVFLFSFMSFFFLWRAMRDGRPRDFFLSGLALWPPVLLHFSGLLAAGGAGLTLIVAWLQRRVPLKGLLFFILPCGLAMACVLPFLSSLFQRETGIAAKASFHDVALSILDRLNELMCRELYPEVRIGLAALTLLGLFSLFLRDRLLAWICLGWMLPPLLVLLAVRYSTYFNPWHLIFLMPPILTCQARALSLLFGKRLLPWLAVLLVGSSLHWYMTKERRHYYEPASYSGHYKQQAASLVASHLPGTVYIYPESGVTSPLNWYLDQFSEPSLLRAQRLGPDETFARAVTPGAGGVAGVISRSPVQEMGPLPYRTRITCAPNDFLSRVHRLEYLACQPVLEDILIATQAGRTGFAEFVFHNSAELPQAVTVHFGFSNRKAGNRFAVSCRFDDEPWSAAFQSVGPDNRGHDKIEILRDKPYRIMTVRFELWRNGLAPTFTGEDLEAVRLVDFKVEALQAH